MTLHPMPDPTSERTRRDLRAIFADGIAFSLMVGLGETYIPAFALALGMSEVAAGWIVSIPLIFGALLQLISPYAIRGLKSHKRWVVLCASAQAIIFLIYAAAAFIGALPTIALYLIAAIYWAAGLATGPAWNTWVATLIPKPIRATYFARRSRIAQGAVLAGVIIGGLALQWGSTDQTIILRIFGLLFLAAGLARAASAILLASQSEPNPLPDDHRVLSPREWLTRLNGKADGRILIYMLAVQVAVQISGPFFTPFMLKQLHFSYGEYLLLISMSFGAKMTVLPFVGSLARRLGPQTLLYAAGFGIIPLAGLWVVSNSLAWLMLVQILSGSIWAVYELCTFLLLFDHIEEKERTSVLTTFNLFNAAAMVGGALIGGTLLTALGADRSAYLILFALSSGLRLVSIIFLLRLRHTTFEPKPIAMRALAARPNTGSLDAPIIAGMDEGEGERHEGRGKRHEA